VLVVDTGPLVATADRADKDHAACRALLEGDDGPLVTTGLVIAKAAYLIDRQLGPAAEAALYSTITAASWRSPAWTCRTGTASASWSPATPTCGWAGPTRR
jgi:predicted nucleic acid-binding protein